MKIYVKTLFKAIDNFVYGYISERIVIQLFLIFFLLWIIFYGVTVSKGFHFTLLDSTILYILIPLFIIDAFKSAIETFFRQDFYKGTEELKKITVIIPTYNGGKVIKNTLVDLLHKFKPSQIIVSSNGSVDDTCDIGPNP